MKLRQEVFNEAVLLNQHTTQEEKDKLVVELVDQSSIKKCIYGLMTGDCNNERATELIKKCVPSVKEERLVFGASIRTLYAKDYEQSLLISEGTPIEVQIMWNPYTIPTIIGVIKGDIINNN